jgi:hypothetical protein
LCQSSGEVRFNDAIRVLDALTAGFSAEFPADGRVVPIGRVIRGCVSKEAEDDDPQTALVGFASPIAKNDLILGLDLIALQPSRCSEPNRRPLCTA